MKFLSFEDLTGTFEATLFPDAYAKYASLTLDSAPLEIQGRIEDDMGAVSIIVASMRVL